MTFGVELIVIGLMLLLNAVFASYEMALASISRARLMALCQQKKKGAEQAAFMKDRMEASLAVVQLGITFAGALAAATGGAGVQESFTPFLHGTLGVPDPFAEVLAVICLVIPLSAFTIIFAELVPKMFALQNKEWVLLSLSPAMKGIAWIAHPAVSVFERTVKRIMTLSSGRLGRDAGGEEQQGLHELKAAATLARTSRLIGAAEEKIVLSAAEFSRRTVSGIMLPASDIVMIPVTDNLSDAFIKAHLDMHTRYPVCEREKDPQTIMGYVNFKDIINALKVNPASPDIRGITRPIPSVNKNLRLSDVLSQLIHDKTHIALVRQENEKIVGLIALEDLIEELVGDIEDEYDRLPNHIHAFGSSWIMGGGVPMGLVFTTLGRELEAQGTIGGAQTLAEWVNQKLGRSPEPGEILKLDNLTVTARKLRRKKIYECIINLMRESVS
ncbi:MAG TPA: hemolysin family protein [Candidatus Omnitrophota bacterium]|nr:hemolysin family protein [Candidatus Omnitrophota bacterium]